MGSFSKLNPHGTIDKNCEYGVYGYALPEYDAASLERIYTRYLDVKEDERAATVGNVAAFADQADLNLENEEDFLVFLLSLSAMSSYLKNAVQILLESHYPDLNEEKTREEQEKKEAAKRAKAEQKAEKKAAKGKKEALENTDFKEGQ